MHKLCAFILIVVLFAALLADSYSEPDNYYKNYQNLTGELLKLHLHDIIKDHIVFPYFSDNSIASKDILFITDQDTANPDNIICFYSGFSYPKNWLDIGRNEDYSLLGTTIDNTWNREHVWSKSHGFPDRIKDIAYSDVHNLRPEDRTVNSSKAAKDFDWGGFPDTEAPGCFTDSDSWEPPDRVKGDVARCIFYMATRYEGSDTTYDLEPVDYTNTDGDVYGRLSTLLEWHKLDPPDDFERRRNQIIFSEFQKNRNPFIDHPEFAFAIWGDPDYLPRISFSSDIIHFDAVQNSAYSTQEVMVTIVNHSKLVDIFIEEHPQIFQFPTKSGTVRFIPKDGFINDHLTINFNPSLAGEYSSSVIFDGFDQEIELSARILPEKGNWLIIENFEESLGDFNHNVLQGNPRYGWHHSSWDNDKFARLRGSYDDYEPRECWLISPPLAVNNISQFFLNFRTARNDNKSPDQLQVYLASNLPIDGIPADAVKLNPQLSEGNYDWKNSSWLILSKSQLPKADSLYLLFRYYFNGNTHGQETWELDNIKFYGAY